jgi:hypothetical protein
MHGFYENGTAYIRQLDLLGCVRGLFMFSKFKNFLNSFNGKLFKFRFISFVGILCKITVFFPLIFYSHPLFGGQMSFESLEGFQMSVEVSKPQKLFKAIGTSTSVDNSVVFQINEFGIEGIPELCSGPIEFLPLQKINGVLVGFSDEMLREPISKPNTKKNSKDSGNSSKHNVAHCFIGYLLGSILAIIGVEIYFKLKNTQRAAQGRRAVFAPTLAAARLCHLP